jgi:chromosome segregation ATPase
VPHRLEVALARERDAQSQIALLERRLAQAEAVSAEVVALRYELDETRTQLDARARTIELLETQKRELLERVTEAEAEAERFRTVNEGLMGSLSWRLTRPLRALKPGRR